MSLKFFLMQDLFSPVKTCLSSFSFCDHKNTHNLTSVGIQINLAPALCVSWKQILWISLFLNGLWHLKRFTLMNSESWRLTIFFKWKNDLYFELLYLLSESHKWLVVRGRWTIGYFSDNKKNQFKFICLGVEMKAVFSLLQYLFVIYIYIFETHACKVL